ncbi:MAG: thioredoxin family protein [bacterium]|nr:thioredoxin family protein [bacterium]
MSSLHWKTYGTPIFFQSMLLLAVAVFLGCKDQQTPESSEASSISVNAHSAGDAPADEAAAPQPVSPPQSEAGSSFYTVDHYDPQADPAQQLQSTLARARAEQKTVLLQVGGDWCGWCKLMSQFMHENEAVNRELHASYLIQKVTYDSANRNEEFLGAYPAISGYPHLFVLDAEGNLLHSQNTAELEAGKSYDEQAFVEFLRRWKPHNSGD